MHLYPQGHEWVTTPKRKFAAAAPAVIKMLVDLGFSKAFAQMLYNQAKETEKLSRCNEDDEDPCDKIEKDCKGHAKNVERQLARIDWSSFCDL